MLLAAASYIQASYRYCSNILWLNIKNLNELNVEEMIKISRKIAIQKVSDIPL